MMDQHILNLLTRHIDSTKRELCAKVDAVKTTLEKQGEDLTAHVKKSNEIHALVIEHQVRLNTYRAGIKWLGTLVVASWGSFLAYLGLR